LSKPVKIHLRILVPLVAISFAAIAFADTPSRYDSGPRQAIEKARAAWAMAHPPNYTFKVSLVCFCLTPPVHVTVRKGKVVGAVMEQGFNHKYSGKSVPSGDRKSYFAVTVPELLALVDASLQDRTIYSSASFDKELGFPTDFDTRPGILSPADSTVGFSVEAFKVQK
jgi:hypothetical protein